MTTALPPSAATTLLIVDDDQAIRTLLADSLGRHGFRIETASNAREMDVMLARHSISLILLDIMMPGEDGLSSPERKRRPPDRAAERAGRGTRPDPGA